VVNGRKTFWSFYMPKSTEQLVLEKLDQLLRVLTISVTSGLKQKEQIALLDRAGFQPKDIAGLLGTTGNTDNVALNAQRKVDGNKPKRRKSAHVKKQ
jgi:hypothetical protein